jgi:CTP:molybdopterin cytidylyltransferase MocA
VRATAIIPVKRFGRAKQRLLEALDRPARAAVVKAMLRDVLAAASDTRNLDRLIIVTGEGRAERIALHHAQRSDMPLEVLRDPDDAGHPQAATLGIVRAKALGAECVALLPGDCPLLESEELDDALGRGLTGCSCLPRTRSARASARAAESVTSSEVTRLDTRFRSSPFRRSPWTSTRRTTWRPWPSGSPTSLRALRRPQPS